MITTGYLWLSQPRWIQFSREGKTAWLDMVDGKFAFGGDLEPTEAARVFLDTLGGLLNDRIADAAKKRPGTVIVLSCETCGTKLRRDEAIPYCPCRDGNP